MLDQGDPRGAHERDHDPDEDEAGGFDLAAALAEGIDDAERDRGPDEGGTGVPQGDGPAATSAIASGSYAIPAADGPVPGPYLVEIHSIRPTGKAPTKPVDPDYEAEETVDLIPPKYHRDSQLTIEVKPGGPQTFDFPLESASAKGSRPKGGR